VNNNVNPFEVLRLDPASTEEEVVRRAGQLRQRAADEAALTALRQAVQALTGRPEERLLHALLTPPRPAYSWPALERFVNAFRRPPQVSPAEAPPPAELDLDLDEFAALLRPLVIAELTPSTPLPFTPPPTEETAEEIDRQTAEGLWQTLPFEPPA
jgi:hypothetical protein